MANLTIHRGDHVKIKVQHYVRDITSDFFLKDGQVCGVNSESSTPLKVLVIGVGIKNFRENELEKV